MEGAVFGSPGPSSARPCAHAGIGSTLSLDLLAQVVLDSVLMQGSAACRLVEGGTGRPPAAASAGEMEALAGRGVVEAQGPTATRQAPGHARRLYVQGHPDENHEPRGWANQGEQRRCADALLPRSHRRRFTQSSRR